LDFYKYFILWYGILVLDIRYVQYSLHEYVLYVAYSESNYNSNCSLYAKRTCKKQTWM